MKYMRSKWFIIVSIGVCTILSFFTLVFAQKNERGDYGTNPVGILNKVVQNANDGQAWYQIQDSALDYVEAGPGKYRIHNTLEWVRQHISPYIQWMVYIWLTTAVILLIYNGLLLVTWWIHEAWKREKVRWNMLNIWIWVLILTGFYVIFKVVIALINTLVS